MNRKEFIQTYLTQLDKEINDYNECKSDESYLFDKIFEIKGIFSQEFPELDKELMFNNGTALRDAKIVRGLLNKALIDNSFIDYFKNQHINRFFETLNDKYKQNNIPPENWRSVYLLLKESLPSDREPTEDDLLLALDKISSIDAAENYELLQKVKDTNEEVETLRKEIEVLKQEPKTQVIIQEKEKSLDDYGLGQIIWALIKK